MAKVETFAARLRESRSQKGLSKSDLARAVGVSTTCVWNWEEGNTNPRPRALARIAAALLTTEEFLSRGVPPAVAAQEARPIVSAAVASTRMAVGEVILRAREDIAAAAGLALERVKVVLEYGA